ncbi:predicted protein [Coccidioides posadasii str. Silveira]|uniref:Predicted protein n=2 Tax=Coccidioides posadasii TaxID=199306 RepID=E9CUV4_COCPS|nr:predicted protein [Coccidioides posadasii str. Silveira]KMM65467.1 hypothetical protein CPAG_01818 [Coccidioides posadasii RMSCC 3488]
MPSAGALDFQGADIFHSYTRWSSTGKAHPGEEVIVEENRGLMTLILVMYEKGREGIWIAHEVALHLPFAQRLDYRDLPTVVDSQVVLLLSASDRRCRVMETYGGGSTGCRPQSQALQPPRPPISPRK